MGRIERIGAATLYHGDFRDILPTLPKVDLVLTDPPYGIGADKAKAHSSIRDCDEWENNGWDNKTPSGEVFNLVIERSFVQMIWGGNYFTEYLQPTKAWIFWYKGQKDLTMSDGEMAWTSTKEVTRMFDLHRTHLWQEKPQHPTQKPVALASEAIDKTTRKTALVLDLFGGSGSTLIACEKTGRHARLMELDPKYCDVIVRRWQDFTGKQATHEATGATFAEVEADSALAVAEAV